MSSTGPVQFPELTRRKNAQLVDGGGDIEQVGIAADQYVASGTDGRGENGGVIRVSHGMRKRRARCRNDMGFLEKNDELLRQNVGNPEFPFEHTTEFRNDLAGDRKIVPREYETEHVGAESPRCEGTDKDVGVQKDVHEKSRNTSSSTR